MKTQSKNKFSNLKREINKMPEYIIEALKDSDLVDEYAKRPAYQQNDYVGWITRAKREETRMKRLNQMLSELKDGDKYMKMDYRPQK